MLKNMIQDYCSLSQTSSSVVATAFLTMVQTFTVCVTDVKKSDAVGNHCCALTDVSARLTEYWRGCSVGQYDCSATAGGILACSFTHPGSVHDIAASLALTCFAVVAWA